MTTPNGPKRPCGGGTAGAAALTVVSRIARAQSYPTRGTAVVLMHIYDGQPHPSTGNPDYDASAYTQVDANTLILARFKAGKLIAVGTLVISPDGKTFTNNNTGLGSAPGAMTGIAVFDKQ